MSKLKTHKGAAKRFSLTKSGKVKRSKAFRRHILNKKSTKTKRHLRAGGYVAVADEKNVKAMIPYK
ncbi:MAG: 50S ribosomal protein L35 [Oscillospiraceae bacterium]|nr:50S ribosomal protein L35 [Oscillospiraceae bacterium]